MDQILNDIGMGYIFINRFPVYDKKTFEFANVLKQVDEIITFGIIRRQLFIRFSINLKFIVS